MREGVRLSGVNNTPSRSGCGCQIWRTMPITVTEATLCGACAGPGPFPTRSDGIAE